MPRLNVIVLATVLLPATAAIAQSGSRMGVGLSAPGGSGHSSANFGTGYFTSSSYGLGSLQSASPGQGGNVLSANLSPLTVGGSRTAAGAASAASPLAAPGMGAALGAGASPGAIQYSTATSALNFNDTSTMGLAMPDIDVFAASSAYLAGANRPGLAGVGAKEVVSLAPSEDYPGLYRDFLLKGEQAFKDGYFQEAQQQFMLANDIGRKNPESLLSLSHAHFAMSRHSFASAAYHLCQALSYSPELPLVPLRPNAFYGSQSDYHERIGRLESHLERNPSDAEAYLMKAYFMWFEQRYEDAHKALLEAHRNTPSPELAEAVDIFWRGIVASGVFSGELESPTLNQPASGPAAGQE